MSKAVSAQLVGLLSRIRRDAYRPATLELAALRRDMVAAVPAERIVDSIREGNVSADQEARTLDLATLGALVRKEYPALAMFWMGPKIKAAPRFAFEQASSLPSPRTLAFQTQNRDLGLIAALVLEAGVQPFTRSRGVFEVTSAGLDSVLEASDSAVFQAVKELADRNPTELLRFVDHYNPEQITNQSRAVELISQSR